MEAAEVLLNSKLHSLMALVRNWLDDAMLRSGITRVRDVPYVANNWFAAPPHARRI